MGQATDQVRHEADEARQRLVEDLNRLDYRMEELADWHTWFRRHPAAFLGTAFAGALLLGFSVTPRRRARRVPGASLLAR